MERDRKGKEMPKHIVSCITTFRRKQRRGLIDVWWLYDDGGKPSSIRSIRNKSGIVPLHLQNRI